MNKKLLAGFISGIIFIIICVIYGIYTDNQDIPLSEVEGGALYDPNSTNNCTVEECSLQARYIYQNAYWCYGHYKMIFLEK